LRDLSPDESTAILNTVSRLTKNREIAALCAYGSQIAGYASKNSDYDVILVVKPFSQKIKYYYLKGEVECSALVVEARAFENDCRKSTFGEFAAGRLLNPYSAITGKVYLKENEAQYKKRVILEGISDAAVDFQNFTSEISFPLSYFLFEKLKKRAAIYPPVVYSYSRTYSDELLSTNLPATLDGFKIAAADLHSEGIVTFQDGADLLNVVPVPNGFHGGLSGRIESAASYTSKSIRQYAVHGYAGRVSPNVVGKEVVSKISRSRKSSKLPDRIRNPRKEWSLTGSKLFLEGGDWLGQLIEYLGMNEKTCKITQSSLGEVYTTAGFYSLKDEASGREVSIAVKRYKDIRGMKWGVLNLWTLKNANFTVNPTERLFREFRATKELPKFGLATHEIIAVFWPQKTIVSKFLEGKDLSKIEAAFFSGKPEQVLSPITAFGQDLAIMHNNSYCMGDTKPSNVIYSENESKIYLTDLEQAVPFGNKTWDLAEFIYYSVRFTLKEEPARKLVAAFVEGYSEKTEDLRPVEEASLLRYSAPFQPFVAPNVMNALRRDLKK
jgi:tRNA A-37 threonylcarbamoyl transferase component Bud32